MVRQGVWKMKLSMFSLSYNEEEHIEYWIDNHRPFVDEIILVDTGSTDNTIKIALEKGLSVIQYDWKHHFADAKNFAISYCNGDWLLSLEVDTYIDNRDFAGIRELMKNKEKCAYQMPFVNHTKGWWSNEGVEPGSANHTSLFRKSKDIFYTGRVHETIDSSLKNKGCIVDQIPVLKHHDCPCLNNPEKNKYYETLREIWKLEDTLNILRDKSEQYEKESK